MTTYQIIVGLTFLLALLIAVAIQPMENGDD